MMIDLRQIERFEADSSESIQGKVMIMNEQFRIYSSSSDATWQPEEVSGELPCQNCGELVFVLTPFVGCVFCVNCISLSGEHKKHA